MTDQRFSDLVPGQGVGKGVDDTAKITPPWWMTSLHVLTLQLLSSRRSNSVAHSATTSPLASVLAPDGGFSVEISQHQRRSRVRASHSLAHPVHEESKCERNMLNGAYVATIMSPHAAATRPLPCSSTRVRGVLTAPRTTATRFSRFPIPSRPSGTLYVSAKECGHYVHSRGQSIKVRVIPK